MDMKQNIKGSEISKWSVSRHYINV